MDYYLATPQYLFVFSLPAYGFQYNNGLIYQEWQTCAITAEENVGGDRDKKYHSCIKLQLKMCSINLKPHEKNHFSGDLIYYAKMIQLHIY